MNSIIILTHGWTGSSVFSGLLGRAGYWLGEATAKKSDYDTFENAGSVRLNQRWMETVAPDLRYEQRFDAADPEQVSAPRRPAGMTSATRRHSLIAATRIARGSGRTLG